MATERLCREGVDTSHFIELLSANTGTAMVFQEAKTGAQAGLIATSANNNLPLSLIGRVQPEIQTSDLIFTELGISSSFLTEVCETCRRLNKRLILHASPVQPPVHFHPSPYYLLVADDFEALLLTGRDHIYAAIEDLHRRGVQNVVIRHNHTFLTVSDGGQFHIQHLPQFSSVRNDAGATECLTAWTGISLAVTNSLDRAAAVGAQAMSFCLARPTAQDSFPYPSELKVEW
jgi:sugar/nucleoside kinase (ribokinase family)